MSKVTDINKVKIERTAIAIRDLNELVHHMFIGAPQARLKELEKELTKKQRGENGE